MAGGLLLTGGTGQVGGALRETLGPLARLVGEVHAPGRAALDLADAASIRSVVRSLRPRWLVSLGAYTAVDKAESEPSLARAINTDAPRLLGEEAARIGAAVLHLSTDYVFSGEGTTAHTELDPTGPRSVYGTTKLAGEQVLAASGAAHIILRTSWIYGATGKNFLLTVLRLARERAEIKIVADQHGAPTWSRDLARLLAQIVVHSETTAADLSLPLAEAVSRVSGVYHASSAGDTTWHGFAHDAICEMRLREPQTRWATLQAIATADYPTAAQRPANSRLNCEKLHRIFGIQLPGWRDSLTQVLDELSGPARP